MKNFHNTASGNAYNLHFRVMLLQFSTSNYRCFHKLQTLNLAATPQDKSLVENCIEAEFPAVPSKRWVKGVALYGTNASGKTTVISALRALTTLVTQSAQVTDPKAPIEIIDPFALFPGCPEQPTAFSAVIAVDAIRYEYRVAATRERIWHESLRAFPEGREQMWFCRQWDPKESRYTWSPERPTGYRRDQQLESYTLQNMLYLSKAIASNREEVEPIFRWFRRLQFLDLSTRAYLGDEFTVKQLKENTELCAKIIGLLRHADLGVTGAKAVEKPIADFVKMGLPAATIDMIRKQGFHIPQLMHRGRNDAEVALPWESESAGTHRLLAIAGPWLDILVNGYVVCIDELETSMHPLMVRELLRLFFSQSENSSGAQILFTTHNPLLLDTTFIRRDQVWFTAKSQTGEAHLYPLTDYAPRKDESLIRGYLSGRYGAVPYVPSGLTGEFPGHEVLADEEGALNE